MQQERLEKIRARIAALRAKAEDQSVTEAEALAFAAKAAELMQQHGITLEDVERSKEADFVEEADMSTVRGRRHEVDLYGNDAICDFCDVRCFFNYTEIEGKYGWAATFYGYRPDVDLAHFLRTTLMRACETSWKVYRPKIHLLAGGKANAAQLSKARRSFMLGFFQRVQARLREIKNEQTQTGTGLVVAKRAMVERHYTQAHPDMGSFARTRRDTYGDVRRAGDEAGGKASLNRPVGGDAGILAITAR